MPRAHHHLRPHLAPHLLDAMRLYRRAHERGIEITESQAFEALGPFSPSWAARSYSDWVARRWYDRRWHWRGPWDFGHGSPRRISFRADGDRLLRIEPRTSAEASVSP